MTIPLTVPGTSQLLEPTADGLRSADGAQSFKVVHGVPLLLPSSAEPTFEAYQTSRRTVDCDDPWQVESLSISDAQRDAVRKGIQSNVEQRVDPVVGQLVGATNGLAYESSLGKLDHYPIPKIPLPAGNGASFLDIGCSWGRWCASAARLGYQVNGIDPSLGAVLAAQRMFGQLGLQGRFVCGDGRALPFPDNSFDVVFSYSVLQHFSFADVDATYDEISRVLKPGGKAVIEFANALGVRSLYHLLRRRFRPPTGFEVRYRRPAQLIRLGEQHLGPSQLSIDCFGGLGLQSSDQHLYGWPARSAVKVSEVLKKTARILPPLKLFADSLYLHSTKNHAAGDRNRLNG